MDPRKTDAKKGPDPDDISLIKKRFQKAKPTMDDIQKLNIKQGTSLKNSAEKVYGEKETGTSHLGPSFEYDQYGLPRLTPSIKQPVWVHN